MTYTDEEGALAVKLARSTIEHSVGGAPLLDLALTETFKRNAGAFVTLNTYPDHRLRGCIGYPEPHYPLEESIRRGAQQATRDPRFPPLAARELGRVLVEVSILTPPERIVVKKPTDYPRQVVVGRDGLIVGKRFHRGLLLPQVATEYGWDSKEFLAETCMKAGLMPDAWLDEDAEIWRFTAEIFSEGEPRGPPRRKGR